MLESPARGGSTTTTSGLPASSISGRMPSRASAATNRALAIPFAARFSETFVASLRANYYRVWLDEGNFETTVLGLRAAYSFTPRIYLQTLLQYSDQTDSFSSNLRFGWLGTAGTGLYVVYNDTENTLAGPERPRGPLDRTLVVKYTRQFDVRR